jgi:hypothetical protein
MIVRRRLDTASAGARSTWTNRLKFVHLVQNGATRATPSAHAESQRESAEQPPSYSPTTHRGRKREAQPTEQPKHPLNADAYRQTVGIISILMLAFAVCMLCLGCFNKLVYGDPVRPQPSTARAQGSVSGEA